MKPDKIAYISATLYIIWGLLCFIINGEMNYSVLLRWGVFIPLFIIAGSLPDKNIIYLTILAFGILQSIIVILQQARLIPSDNPFFCTTGFLGNPGLMGGFQAIALTTCLGFLKTCRNAIPIGLFAVLIAYSIIISGSRGAWVAALFGSAVLYRTVIARSHLYSHKSAIIVLLLLCIAFITGLYFYRPASANARLLIWNVSANIIQDYPIFGIGPGRFRSVYMLYQADYFAKFPLSKFTIVADNAAYPYNEFLRIAIEQGTIGLLIFLILIFSSINNSTADNKIAPLAALLLFSFFSYPADKPSMAILFPILFGACANNHSFKFRKSLIITSLLLLLATTISALAVWRGIERDTGKIETTYDKEAMERLKRELPHFYTDIRFNCRYIELSKSFNLLRTEALLLRYTLPTCENWCYIGNFYYEAGELKLAEKYFRQAANMIPTRLLPKYYLWRLLVAQNRDEEASAMATIIMTQRTKVENTTTIRIKQEVKKSTQ